MAAARVNRSPCLLYNGSSAGKIKTFDKRCIPIAFLSGRQLVDPNGYTAGSVDGSVRNGPKSQGGRTSRILEMGSWKVLDVGNVGSTTTRIVVQSQASILRITFPSPSPSKSMIQPIHGAESM